MFLRNVVSVNPNFDPMDMENDRLLHGTHNAYCILHIWACFISHNSWSINWFINLFINFDLSL